VDDEVAARQPAQATISRQSTGVEAKQFDDDFWDE
jgi:hypothetical protein